MERMDLWKGWIYGKDASLDRLDLWKGCISIKNGSKNKFQSLERTGKFRSLERMDHWEKCFITFPFIKYLLFPSVDFFQNTIFHYRIPFHPVSEFSE